MRRRNTEELDTVLGRFLRQEGLETPLNEYRLIQAWPEMVGNTIARYTASIRIYNQVLYVQLSSPALRENLIMERKLLVKRLNACVGAQVITDIIFR